MDNIGKVQGLYISSIDKKRLQKDSIKLDSAGIIGDKFYGKDIERSILVSSIDSYIIAKENGIDIEYGYLGENIILDINPYGLSKGDTIVIGQKVILEITQNCTICNSLGKVHKELPNILKTDRGIFAKCIKSGSIIEGDKVELIAN